MAKSTRLVILDLASDRDQEYIYSWGRKRFLLPVPYFPTNLVYPFTLRDNKEERYSKFNYKTRKNAIVEYLDYQIPVTQIQGPK